MPECSFEAPDKLAFLFFFFWHTTVTLRKKFPLCSSSRKLNKPRLVMKNSIKKKSSKQGKRSAGRNKTRESAMMRTSLYRQYDLTYSV